MQTVKSPNNQCLMRFSCFSLLLILAILAGTVFFLPASASEIAVITASRDISAESVYPGDSFNVSVRVRALQVLEAPALNEDLPAGWSAIPLESDGAVFLGTETFREASLEWVWAERLSSGEEKTVVYEVTVPEAAEFTNYSISGYVSAYNVSALSVEGPSPAVEVLIPPPVADFSAGPLSGTAPLSVQFADLSLYMPDSWKWDFSGDGSVDSELQNPSFAFNTAGTYNVSLTVFRGEFNDTETKTGYITVGSKTSTGGSSGGGGGGGGSPEPNSNIELKELANQQVFKGTPAHYAFRAEANDITAIEFDPKKSFGKTTAIIESLKDTSSLVPFSPEGKVYRNMNIWVGNSGFSNPENLENAKISFRVERSWINENNIELSTIALLRFSEDMWNSLPTEQVGADAEYLYFEAETPGFSPFAITGRAEDSPDTGSSDTGSSDTGSSDTGSSDTGSQGLEPDASGDMQASEGGRNSGTEVGGEGAFGKISSERIPGFEAFLLALCLLFHRAVKRKP